MVGTFQINTRRSSHTKTWGSQNTLFLKLKKKKKKKKYEKVLEIEDNFLLQGDPHNGSFVSPNR